MASEEQTALSVAELQAQISELPAGRDRETERQRAMGFVQLGQAQFNLGNDREAVDSLGEAERILSAMRGMQARIPEVALMRGELLGGRMREYEQALAATDQLMDGEGVADMPDFVTRVSAIRFTALRKLGRWAQASAEADNFLSRVQEPSASEREREVIRQAYYARSVAFMKRGDPESALLAADAAIATARTLPADTKRLGSMLLLRAGVLEALGRRSDARAAYRDVVRQSRHDRDELARSQVKLARLRSLELLAAVARCLPRSSLISGVLRPLSGERDSATRWLASVQRPPARAPMRARALSDCLKRRAAQSVRQCLRRRTSSSSRGMFLAGVGNEIEILRGAGRFSCETHPSGKSGSIPPVRMKLSAPEWSRYSTTLFHGPGVAACRHALGGNGSCPLRPHLRSEQAPAESTPEAARR